MAHGPIPDGQHVCHHCDNRSCVRPDHLFLGTNADNVADRVAKKRSAGAPRERNAHAKLTETQVADIRARWRPRKTGRPRRGEVSITSTLATEYGVTVSTIYHIARGWTWRN